MTITIPDAVAPRVQAALCAQRGVPLGPGAEPVTCNAATAKAVVLDYIKNITRSFEAEQASRTARDEAMQKADSDLALS